MGLWGVGASSIGWYEDCCCGASRDAIGDHQCCASWLRSEVKEKADGASESEYHEDKDWEPEECGEEKISSAEGGLEVNVVLFGWLIYLCCCLANAPAEGEGIEIAGDWLKMVESYC